MSKYLLILVIVVVLYALARSRGKAPSPPAPSARRLKPPEHMVACAHCGLHLPRGDALPQGRHFYCCVAHRDQGPA